MRNLIYVKKNDEKVEQFLITKDAEGGPGKNQYYIDNELYTIVRHTKSAARGRRPHKIFFDNRILKNDADLLFFLISADEVETF